MNQVGIWLSILVRKLLKRASFTSVEALKTRVLAFVKHSNWTIAKPFKRTYNGQVLRFRRNFVASICHHISLRDVI